MSPPDAPDAAVKPPLDGAVLGLGVGCGVVSFCAVVAPLVFVFSLGDDLAAVFGAFFGAMTFVVIGAIGAIVMLVSLIVLIARGLAERRKEKAGETP